MYAFMPVTTIQQNFAACIKPALSSLELIVFYGLCLCIIHPFSPAEMVTGYNLEQQIPLLLKLLVGKRLYS